MKTHLNNLIIVMVLCGAFLLLFLVFFSSKVVLSEREINVSTAESIEKKILFLSERLADHNFDEKKVFELLGESRLPVLDNWGNEFRISCRKGEIVISSAGVDLVFETPDDVVGTYERTNELESMKVVSRNCLFYFSSKTWEPAFTDASQSRNH